MRYVRTCAVCGATLWADDDPPTREAVERFHAHERGHAAVQAGAEVRDVEASPDAAAA